MPNDAPQVLAVGSKILTTGKAIAEVSGNNLKAAGSIMDAAVNQGAKEAMDTFKEVGAQALGSAAAVVVSTAIDINATANEPAYSIPEKALIISADTIYAGAGVFVLATTFSALAALGPIGAVVNSGAGIVKYSAQAAGSLIKHLRYKKELGAIEENIQSLDRAIHFLKADKERMVNFPDLIKDIKGNIFKLKELGYAYEKLPQEFRDKLDALEKSYTAFSHTRKAYDQFLSIAKRSEVLLKEHIQNNTNCDPQEIEKLNRELAEVETTLANNKNLNSDTVDYLKEKCEALRTVLEPLKSSENRTNLQKAKGSVDTLANGVLRHKKETTVKMANTDPIRLLEQIKKDQVHLSNAAKTKISQNKRDGWQNVGKVAVSVAVLGVAIAGLFFPPLGIAVTAIAAATSVGFLGYTAYKKYKAYKENKALKEKMAADKSVDIPTNGLDKTDKNELTVAAKVEHEHAQDLDKLSALITEESTEPQPDSNNSAHEAHEVLPGFEGRKKESDSRAAKSPAQEEAPSVARPKHP